MFETDDFRARLESAIRNTAEPMRAEINRIADYLQREAVANEDELIRRETERPPLERRGVNDAIDSARRLTAAAVELARLHQHDVVELSDVVEALQAGFCGFWPFCR